MSFRIELQCDAGGPEGAKSRDDCLSNAGDPVGVTLWTKAATTSVLRSLEASALALIAPMKLRRVVASMGRCVIS